MVQNMAAEGKIWAEWRVAELLKEQLPHKGGRPKKLSQASTVSKLSEIGITRNQSSRWQKVFELLDEDADPLENHVPWFPRSGYPIAT